MSGDREIRKTTMKEDYETLRRRKRGRTKMSEKGNGTMRVKRGLGRPGGLWNGKIKRGREQKGCIRTMGI